jgi:hypothetical protein
LSARLGLETGPIVVEATGEVFGDILARRGGVDEERVCDVGRPTAIDEGPLLAHPTLSAYGSFLAHSAHTGSKSGTRASGRGQSVIEQIAIVAEGRIVLKNP